MVAAVQRRRGVREAEGLVGGGHTRAPYQPLGSWAAPWARRPSSCFLPSLVGAAAAGPQLRHWGLRGVGGEDGLDLSVGPCGPGRSWKVPEVC